MKDCPKCHMLHEKEGDYCSRKCANSRTWTDEDKLKKSQSAKKSEKVRIANDKLSKEKRKNYIDTICPICKKKFSNSLKRIKIYCSKKCYLKDDKLLYRKNSKGGKRQGSGRGKKGWYKGYFCDSSWELAWVIFNLEHNISFERNNEGFEYEFEGVEHKYYPDFKMEDGSYVEVKGYMTEQNKCKIQQFKGKLQIIFRDNIKFILDYVVGKYGNKFIDLYEGNPHNEKKSSCGICGNPAKYKFCSRVCSGKAVQKIRYSCLK